jgi:predicted DNA-binding transcriptional regulator YafY
MKNYLNAPIVFDRSAGGYKYDRSAGESYELPGLWFNASELQALAIMQRLLKDAGGGILFERLAPLQSRLDQLTQDRRLNLGEAAQRLRFPAIAGRPAGTAFNTVAAATLQRRKLWIEYHSRGKDEHTDRTVSPQRIVHYREAWYLDAWDGGKDALRSFSIDRISRVATLNEDATDINEATLDEHFASAYGIFGGKADKTAILRFTPERARWVADEEWHPAQEGHWLDDGSYELRIPYAEPRELVMDVLRHGAGVEVVAPEGLRQQVADELRRASTLYRP